MEKEQNIIQMEILNIKVILSMVYIMEKEKEFMKVVHIILDNLKMD